MQIRLIDNMVLGNNKMNNKNNNIKTSTFKIHTDHDNKFLIVPFIKVILQKSFSEVLFQKYVSGRFWDRCDKDLFSKTQIKTDQVTIPNRQKVRQRKRTKLIK